MDSTAVPLYETPSNILTMASVGDPWNIVVQHAGFVALGSVCMLSNGLALLKFFKEAKCHQFVGQRPLLLAGLIADFVHGLAFTSAGGVTLARAEAHREESFDNLTTTNDTIDQANLWRSCMRTFYVPSLVLLHAFMALVVVCTSVDRLTAVATPVFYAQCVKPRHCYMLLTLVTLASCGALVAAYSTDVLPLEGTALLTTSTVWTSSACIAPLANTRYARYYYGGLCSLLTASILIDLVSFLSFKKMARQRGNYETNARDIIRNYLPRVAFGQVVEYPAAQSSHHHPPSSAQNHAHVVQQRPQQSRMAFESAATTTSSAGCTIPTAMLTTTLTVVCFFLVPAMFLWFATGAVSDEDERDRAGSGAYISWGFIIYSIINSLIFFAIRKALRRGICAPFAHLRAFWRRCLCANGSSSTSPGACETTPVEVIGDPASSSSASNTTLSSMSSHQRMKKPRPSIVPLAYGTTEM